MSDSSRARARTRPYPRHREFEKELRKVASAWFNDKGFAVSARYPYILADREEWSQNIASYYQFFREVIFALELGGSFVLLSDERSLTFSCDGPQGKRGLMPFLLSLVPQSVLPRVATVSVQQVVAAIKASERHGWITEFERKYGLM